MSERLGHKNAGVKLGIYTHIMHAVQLTPAKISEDAMADVIEAELKSRKDQVPGNVWTSLKKSA